MRRSCSPVNWISSNDDVKSISGGIVVTRCGPPLRCRLGALRLSCPNKWLRTREGSGSKHTLQTLHNNKRIPSMLLRTTRPTSRSSSGVCSMGGWINLRTLPFAHCCQDFGLGLNCFTPHVALWNGTRGYHCGQMCSYSNQQGKDICHRRMDWQ